MIRAFTIIIVVSCLIISCSKSGTVNNGSANSGGGGVTTTNCTSVPKSFATDVNPIIQSFCNVSGCHNSGSTNGPGPLTNYNQVFAARISIRAAIASGAMPQNATLSVAQKNSILCWIDSGADNN
ncbi:MAG TPA: hypothetical protein VKC90_04180 [Chitinophagaceae bacterium]|nr:hypothetical protein [Chitinophagaceae bacterium]